MMHKVRKRSVPSDRERAGSGGLPRLAVVPTGLNFTPAVFLVNRLHVRRIKVKLGQAHLAGGGEAVSNQQTAHARPPVFGQNEHIAQPIFVLGKLFHIVPFERGRTQQRAVLSDGGKRQRQVFTV